MGKSLSLDLRRRIISKVEQGSSRNAVARQFSVAPSTVINLWSQFSATGSIEPAKQGRPLACQSSLPKQRFPLIV